MKFTSNQKIFLAVGVILIALLYFGFDYKPKNIKSLEKSRDGNLEVTSIENLLLDANKKLSLEEQTILDALKPRDNNNVEGLKTYASKWYELGYPVISAFYAEQVAKSDSSADSWSIAGTSYGLGFKASTNEQEKAFAHKRAILCFESAISINPEDVANQINLALMYVDRAPQDQPMKGILMLRDLNTKFPQNVGVINQLARLAIGTNQLAKAEERLKQAIAIEPDNIVSICMLADLLAQQEKPEAQVFISKCESLNKGK